MNLLWAKVQETQAHLVKVCTAYYVHLVFQSTVYIRKSTADRKAAAASGSAQPWRWLWRRTRFTSSCTKTWRTPSTSWQTVSSSRQIILFKKREILMSKMLQSTRQTLVTSITQLIWQNCQLTRIIRTTVLLIVYCIYFNKNKYVKHSIQWGKTFITESTHRQSPPVGPARNDCVNGLAPDRVVLKPGEKAPPVGPPCPLPGTVLNKSDIFQNVRIYYCCAGPQKVDKHHNATLIDDEAGEANATKHGIRVLTYSPSTWKIFSLR